MSNNQISEFDKEEYRDSISTVDKSGKRLWVYPKKPSGRFYKWRTWLSWVLLAFLFGMPFVKYQGEPLLLFNIVERRFIIFGLNFGPQDMYLFVLATLTLVVFIVLFTVVFGRLFCGWVCPQTIFMEMVFRKIEYWIEGDANQQRKLNAAPWTSDKVIKKISKQVLFFLIAVLVANTFLAYIIGVDEVIAIATKPVTEHLGGFTAMILFSFAFYFVFSNLREQVCTTICPYGRLQGVMLVDDSIVIAYDYIRGENRGKIRKNEKAARKSDPVSKIKDWVSEAQGVDDDRLIREFYPDTDKAPIKIKGDCIDCSLCVQVCPTGIDIRNGTQLECVNCTACIDACDAVMEKINLPKGLIRYDSINGIEKQERKIITPRTIGYSAFLVVLVALQVFLFVGRSDVETLILRTPGKLYQEISDTRFSNLYNYELINKTNKSFPVDFELMNKSGTIKFVGQPPTVPPNDAAKGVLFIELDKAQLDGRKTKLKIQVRSNGEEIDEVTTTFLGPVQ